MSVASQYPSHGARFQLRLGQRDDTHVRYDVHVYRPTLCAQFALAIALEDGAVDVTPRGVEQADPAGEETPPEWVAVHVGKLGRQLAKSKSWPRRFDRWRDDP